MDKQLCDCLQIRYVKLHFTVVMLADAMLPVDKVSALRGAMGEMLLRANCVRDRDCDFEADCIVRRTMYTKSEITPRFVTTNDSTGSYNLISFCSERRSPISTSICRLFFDGKCRYRKGICAISNRVCDKHKE